MKALEQNPVAGGEEVIDYDSTFVDLQPGDIVKGRIVRVSPDEILVDVGGKSEGVIPIKELSNMPISNPREFIKEGEEIELYVLREEDEDGQLTLSKRRVDQARGWVQATKDFEEETVIHAKVTGVVKGGIIVDAYRLRGFVPASQLRTKGSHEDLVGSELPLKIIEVDQRRNKLILSHRQAVAAEKGKIRAEILQNLEIGQSVTGKVVRIADFGAFIDLGGIDGLLPISEISWQRIQHPSNVLGIGDELTLKVLKVDREAHKISLSLKQLQEDPWATLAQRYHEGMVIPGKITKLANFGAFVEIEPGVEALLPTAEMAEHNAKPEDIVEVGQDIQAIIKRFRPDEKRISLSLREVNRAETAEDVDALETAEE
ncbi:MAG: 30S ribosomal protein S1 [Cyanobacteria bacterium NC_groundwater_1444_Ag_S-0.65um_54_12]|nr:30S ribosomal protein S1 [Cyanobacteria bacterium NC_groundwater_1444_Ag_S-0.65um_54_12]